MTKIPHIFFEDALYAYINDSSYKLDKFALAALKSPLGQLASTIDDKPAPWVKLKELSRGIKYNSSMNILEPDFYAILECEKSKKRDEAWVETPNSAAPD